MTIFTIGFAGKGAEEFFTGLRQAGVKRVVDVRLRNVSQLAGFTKKRDLEYFLRTIVGIDYLHMPELAPTKHILDDYKKRRIDWHEYERSYRQLLQERRPADDLDAEAFDRACLLCSEGEADHCHRRLAAEYLKDQWRDVEIKHL